MVALFGVAGGLGLVIVAEFAAGEARIGRIEQPATRQAQQAERPHVALETGASDADIDSWMQTVLARPLMSAGRRPANQPGGTSRALQNGLPRLAGTLAGGGANVAIFARDDGGHPVIVREGAALGPYRITAIVPNGVTLTGPDGVQTIHPSFGNTPPSSTPVTQDDDSGGPPVTLPGTVPQQNFPGLIRPNFPGLFRPPDGGQTIQPQPPPDGQSQ